MKRNPGASGRAGGDESGRVSSCRAFKVKVRSLQGHGSHWRDLHRDMIQLMFVNVGLAQSCLWLPCGDKM